MGTDRLRVLAGTDKLEQNTDRLRVLAGTDKLEQNIDRLKQNGDRMWWDAEGHQNQIRNDRGNYCITYVEVRCL